MEQEDTVGRIVTMLFHFINQHGRNPESIMMTRGLFNDYISEIGTRSSTMVEFVEANSINGIPIEIMNGRGREMFML